MPTISLKVDAATFGAFAVYAGLYDGELSDFVLLMAKYGFFCMFGESACPRGFIPDRLKNVSKRE